MSIIEQRDICSDFDVKICLKYDTMHLWLGERRRSYWPIFRQVILIDWSCLSSVAWMRLVLTNIPRHRHTIFGDKYFSVGQKKLKCWIDDLVKVGLSLGLGPSYFRITTGRTVMVFWCGDIQRLQKLQVCCITFYVKTILRLGSAFSHRYIFHGVRAI